MNIKNIGLIIICLLSIAATLSINFYSSSIQNQLLSGASDIYTLSYLSFFGIAIISSLMLINRFLRTRISEHNLYEEEDKSLNAPLWIFKVLIAFGLALILYLYIILSPTF